MAKKQGKNTEEKVGSVLNDRQKQFVRYYLGDGSPFGNATEAYWRVYMVGKMTQIVDQEGNITEVPVMKKNPITNEDSSEYNTCRANGSALLANTNVQAYMSSILKKVDVEEEMIKVTKQNDSLASKVQAGALVARLQGKLKDNTSQIDMPALVAVAEGIRNALGSLKK